MNVSGTLTQASDAKLKDNVKQENNALAKLAKLKPVSYDYKKMPELNLPQGIQHGFIAQELATVFPELTKDIKKTILDNDGNQASIFEFKSVNYNGLISVLTAGINELSQELQLLKEEINTLKDSMVSGATSKSSSLENIGNAFMEQNIPNPFADQTTIRYQLPNGTNTAAIIVFDLNGLLIKNYPINSNQSELTIKSSDIGRGLFIYSLVQNGQQLVTKRMIIQ
nr:tail fiber domain-containing protein [uncultured Flavobacterium sp.]